MDQGKREAILTSAHEAFERFGFKKTSIEDIARAAGVAKGTVYLAAPSKAELFYEVLLRELHACNADIAKLIDPRRPADELLVACSQAALEQLEVRPLVRALLLGEVNEAVPSLKGRVGELRTVGEAITADLLRLGQRQGVFRDDLDVDAIASILLDLQSSTVLFHYRGDPLAPHLARRAVAGFDVLLNGLKAPPA
jgi:AcrR family transcriptional regulator